MIRFESVTKGCPDVLTQPMADACDAVSAKLTTTTALAELDSQVAGGAGPDAVATRWLTSTGLLAH
jgi:osmoprotectant transport system substrate-binding protein